MKQEKFDFGGWATKNDLLCADGRTIRRNAFKDDDGRKVPLVYQHNHEDPLRVIGHARLENKNDGVYAWCSLNNTDIGRHVKECVRHGDLEGLSIYANQLTQRGGDVLHGTIRELSIVLAGANPGAIIEFPMLAHGEESETEAYIWCGDTEITYGDDLMTFSHSEESAEGNQSESDPKPEAKEDEALAHAEEGKKASEEKPEKPAEKDDEDETIQDVMDTLNDKQKAAVDFVIDQAISGNDFKMDGKAAKGQKLKDGEESVADVLKTLSEKQMNVVEFLLEQAAEAAKAGDEEEDADDKKASHSALNEDDDALSHTENEGEENIMRNVFDRTDANTEVQENVLSHAQQDILLKDAKRLGSLKASVLEHSAEYGIDQIDYIMPEYREATGNGAPEFIKREQGWVAKVMGGVHHIPFSKFKTTFADITADEARAKGYITAHRKKEEVFSLLRRMTDATTVYKKQKLDRDNAVEITGFDVVNWLKGEMRMMLDEELARAFIIGDGRDTASEDKIDEGCIRPVLRDDSLFVIRQKIEAAEGQAWADALIDATTYAWEKYQGSGNCVAFMTRRTFSNLKLLKDKMGRRIYETDAAIASALGVREIAFMPQMGDDSTVRTEGNKTFKPAIIILDLADYTVGADKGGSVNMFEDFDIDYNQMKYLIETRCSGALVRPYSAIVIEDQVNP